MLVMEMFTVLFIFGLLFESGISAQIYQCPSQLKRDQTLKTFREHCYKFVNEEMYWTEARDACAKNQNGHHVVINDSNTQTFLLDTMDQLGWTNNGVWIGLYESNGQWKWVTGEAVSWSKWDSSEPNNGGLFNEDCALLRRKEGEWHDYPCERLNWKYKSICQYDMEPATTTSPSVFTRARENKTSTAEYTTNVEITTTHSNITLDLPGRNILDELPLGYGLVAGIIAGIILIIFVIVLVVLIYCRKKNSKGKSNTLFDNVTYSTRNDSRENGNNQNVNYQNIRTDSGRYDDLPGNGVNYEQYGSADYATPIKRNNSNVSERDKDAYLTPYSNSEFTNGISGPGDYIKSPGAALYEEPIPANHYDVIDLPKRKHSNDINIDKSKSPLDAPAYVNING